MSRSVLVRFVLVVGLLAGCVAMALSMKPNLGLDLRGGAQFLFQAESSDGTPVTAENVDKTLEVLRQRVDALGVAESTLVRQGDNRILVELPGVTNQKQAENARERIGQTAKLTIHPVVAAVQNPDAKPKGKDVILPTEQNDYLELKPSVISGDQITGARAEQPQQSLEFVVSIDFNGKGGNTWAKITGDAACNPSGDPKRRVAIVLDNKVISSPQVNEGIQCHVGIRGGGTQITGSFTQAEAKELATLIEGGSLPLELSPISDRLVGPTLGEVAIDTSIEAGIIGLIITGLFIILVYRLVGLMATIALASYALLAYAMLLGLGSTLTLPGLAGFVLAIGMAIDANVLVFERAREEFDDSPRGGLPRALGIGFRKAWSAIIDSNVTTLLAAALLFFLGSGPIKGFGVTLSIGVIASMISALIIAQVLCEVLLSNNFLNRHPLWTGIGDIGKVRRWIDENRPDIMSHGRTWLALSGVALVIALAGIFTQPLNLGVEFTGGRQLDYSVTKNISVDEARAAVAKAGFPEAVVQTAETADFTVRTGEIDNTEEQKIEHELAAVGGEVTKVDDQKIGASLGTELRNKALIAFGVAFAAQLIYLAFRFKWTFGTAAVLAMAHDVVLVVGLFAWLHKPIDGIFLAAAMTIVGLSVNDTVVVFDRVRERWWSSKPTDTFEEQTNLAAIETIPRTVNTGLGAMFILAALAILGGDSLQDFAIALLVGLIIGTYSSMFVASPLLIEMSRKWPMERVKKVKVKRSPQDSGAVV